MPAPDAELRPAHPGRDDVVALPRGSLKLVVSARGRRVGALPGRADPGGCLLIGGPDCGPSTDDQPPPVGQRDDIPSRSLAAARRGRPTILLPHVPFVG